MKHASNPGRWSAWLVLLIIFVQLSGCSEDPDLSSEVLYQEGQNTEAPEPSTGDQNPTDSSAAEEDDGLVPFTTDFPPTDDAHIDGGQGFNENLIRLEPGTRKSYLKFDLTPIADIGGRITSAQLQFTVTTDGGDGIISVYLGNDQSWEEEVLNSQSAPETGLLLGTLEDTFPVGSSPEIDVLLEDLEPEILTLILVHTKGNDVAIASKEHPSRKWPRLKVKYRAPEDSAPIDPADPTVPPAAEEEAEEDTEPEDSEDPDPSCQTSGGKANQSGLKTWCWADLQIPEYSGSKGVRFSNDQLVVDSECDTRAVSIRDGMLHFKVDPRSPAVESWCERDYNIRAEVRTNPWDVNNPLGTEEWFGWSYSFSEDYIIDTENQWVFFQIYPGPRGLGPQVSLEVTHEAQFRDTPAGEIYITNKGAPDHLDYMPTGVVPQPGETLDIVVHVIWGNDQNGLLRLWINGNLVHQYVGSNTNPEAPWGGNAKWGIYKWNWNRTEKVQKSLEQGITHLKTAMGPLRMITRYPGDPQYGTDAFDLVAPR